MPKISVIVPIHNAGEYLHRSLDSILGQTEKDLEVLCVDDGSTDDSLDILFEYQAHDSRVKIFAQQDLGYGKTMNKALHFATGDFIANVDPDDWIEPDMFETMLDVSEGCDFVKCGFWFETADESIEYLYADEPIECCPRTLPPDLKMRFFSSQIAIWTCLFRRSFLEEHQIRLHETDGAAYQDTAFIFFANACADKIRILPDKFYHYNKTNDNASTKSPRYPLAPSVEYRWISEWCQAHPEYGMYVRSVLCKCRMGSYMWNMARIDPKDRKAFADMAQQDFKDDWNFIDVRMFQKQELDIFMLAMKDPAAFVDLYATIRRGGKNEEGETARDNQIIE